MNFRALAARPRRAPMTLELTPLIDVVFLLLIFFVVTTTFARREEAALAVNLPEGQGEGAPVDEEALVLTVQAGGRVAVNLEEGPWSPDEVRARLASLHAQNPRQAVQLRGDAQASHGEVTAVLDLVRQTGFRRVQLVLRRAPTP